MTKNAKPQLLLILGVSGSGKTSLAKSLSARTGFVFIDADDFHSEGAKRQMTAGKPLSDEMRLPWLQRITEHLQQRYIANESCVLAVSGLKVWHRKMLFDNDFYTRGYWLRGDFSLIQQRLGQREEHFMPPLLLESQFKDMELPGVEENIEILDCSRSIETLCNQILKELKS